MHATFDAWLPGNARRIARSVLLGAGRAPRRGARFGILPATLVRLSGVLVSGVAFVAAFPPFDVGALAWVALVPLLVAVSGQPPRTAFRLGYAWGVVALGGVFWWLTALGPAVWVLAAAFLAVFPALTLAVVASAERRGARPFAFLLTPLVWTAVEFLRSQGPMGFPWALAGESQHRALIVSQIASVTGVYGISFLVVLVNAVLALLLVRRAGVPALAVTAAAVAAVGLWGAASLRAPMLPHDGPAVLPHDGPAVLPHDGPAVLPHDGLAVLPHDGPAVLPHDGLAVLPRGASATFVAAVVQPDYATRARWYGREDAARDLAALRALTHAAALRGAALVVWPETASPRDIPGDPAMLKAVASWARRDRLSLIASSLEGGRTDSAFAFAPTGALVGWYVKMRLVPFAEFGEQAGHLPGVLPTPHGRIGVAICFESIFPQIARRTVLGGANVLAVLTNDTWFSRGAAAPEQHAAIAAFRAIEEGRYLLRAANNGVSEIVDPHGRVLAALPPGTRGVLAARVAALSNRTFYTRHGDVFGWAAVLVSAALVLPRAWTLVAGQAGFPAFLRLLTVSVLPLAALGAMSGISSATHITAITIGGAPIPLPVLALLLVTILLSLGRPAKELGLRAAGFLRAGAAGLAVVGAVAAVGTSAYAAEGGPLVLVPPAGGWWLGSAVQVVIVGLAFEWWLRGLVYAAAVEWRGWRLAVGWSAVLGMVAAAPRGAEAMVWGLAAGLAFGVIRARWAQVPALALSHGAGNVLLGFLLSPW